MEVFYVPCLLQFIREFVLMILLFYLVDASRGFYELKHMRFVLVNIPLQLFEMGLELSLARLKALAKFAFGMGLTQVII